MMRDSPLNQVQPARGIDNPRDLARLEGKGGFLEGGLHVALSKIAKVAALPSTAAVGLGDGQVAQRGLAARDALLIALDDLPGVVFGAGDLGLLWKKKEGEKASA